MITTYETLQKKANIRGNISYVISPHITEYLFRVNVVNASDSGIQLKRKLYYTLRHYCGTW